MYSIKETYYSIQGEGFHSGRPAIFLRFAGCNLWSGREEDRSDAICPFCDTEFFGVDGEGGGKFRSADLLAEHVNSLWTGEAVNRFVVCTGGEPALQLDVELVTALKAKGFVVAIETNGTIELAEGIDWVCVSPKSGTEVVVRAGQELKVVIPQENQLVADMEGWDFDYFYVQPLEDKNWDSNTAKAVLFCKENPKWRLSLQTHKLIGVR